MLNHEIKLQATAAISTSFLPITANVANYRGNNNYKNQNYSVNRGQQTWQQQQFTLKQNTRFPRRYQDRCQLCGVQGHSAKRCSQLQLQGGSFGRNQQHTNASTPWQPRANVFDAPSYNANNWILDSGATHHLTMNLNNLSLHQPYFDGEEVTIADGSGLPISHTGSNYLSIPYQSLSLKDVLYVPNLQKNLISVYRLCNSNHVSVEFFPALFQVKDLSMGSDYSKAKLRTSYKSGQ